MTQQDWQRLETQINEAFKHQFDKLAVLEKRVEELENARKEEQERPKVSTGRSKRVQQA
jgi:membrane protein involved in colicin uptake